MTMEKVTPPEGHEETPEPQIPAPAEVCMYIRMDVCMYAYLCVRVLYIYIYIYITCTSVCAYTTPP